MGDTTGTEGIERLLAWARGRGVELQGIEPRAIPGRGVGVIATKNLEANQVLLRVPTSLLRTLKTVPEAVSQRLPRDMAVHGLLAADLALDKTDEHAAWNALMPSKEELLERVPLAWGPEAQKLLPETAAQLLARQKAKFARDWAAVRAAFPALAEDDYLYAWLLVNTRTFYHTTPDTERRLSREDRMVLQPVADLFNHADRGCAVSFNARGFTVASDRTYAVGDELCICYGSHGNDVLLAEYGFILPVNRWDDVALDASIEPRLEVSQRRLLADRGFLGNYKLDADTECYRTEVALSVMCMPVAEWRRLVDGAAGAGDSYQRDVDRLLAKVLSEFSMVVRNALDAIAEATRGHECQREVLETRWAQIQYLVSSSILRLGLERGED